MLNVRDAVMVGIAGPFFIISMCRRYFLRNCKVRLRIVRTYSGTLMAAFGRCFREVDPNRFLQRVYEERPHRTLR